MTNKYEEIADILSNIPDGETVLVCGHMYPDEDSIGSGCALTLFLRKLNKRAFFLLADKDRNTAAFVNKKECIISRYDEAAEFTFVMVDSNRKRRMDADFAKCFDRARLTINIDHHENNELESDVVLSLPEFGSTSEIVFNLLSRFSTELDQEIASLIYAGILSDTMGFMINMRPNTFSACAKLLTYNIDNTQINKTVRLNKTIDEIETLKSLLQGLTIRDKLYYIVLDAARPCYNAITSSSDLKKYSTVLKNIEGYDILAVFILRNHLINGVFWSNGAVEVESLAKTLGGGGHRQAAGFDDCRLTVDEIVDMAKQHMQKFA
jgi:phosphoesterase RecJ-like protein